MVEIKNYFCCNPDCHKYGLRDQNNIVKAGTYGTGERKKQMLKCTECGKRFSETQNTIFFNSNYTPKTIQQIIRCVAEGNGVRGTARILELDKNSVNNIILKAGQHCELVLTSLIRSLQIEECQLDELWTFIRKKNSIRRGYGKGIWKDMDMDFIG
jgi:transposase-like protein